ncbi:MAG: hypothetical protein IJ593_00150 [Lachnospiraceae bacterium]|nr:hypothetical protein [Lachnospiraceae bacterium]
MKGLSIEQKAKAYDKALGKAEDALNDGTISNNTIAYLQDIFPELKESEDEKIRKTLIRFHKSTIDVDGIKGEDIIAWLENLNLIKANSPQLGEQKTTDKVESKFKVGDWVIDRQDIVHQIANVIENVTNHTYGYDIVGGGYFNDNVEGVRLWTIQDAKDGDVLVTKKGNLFIYDKNRYDNGLAYYYVGLVNKELTIKGPHNMLGHFGELHSVFPATKEQHDTLLKAMAGAGYEWSNKDRKLIKIVK